MKVLTSLTSCLLHAVSHQLCGDEAKCFGTCNLLLLCNLAPKMPTRFPSYPLPVEKQLAVVWCPAWTPPVSPASPLPFFSVCYCWICPLFRWLVAMLLSSLCSLALWWIVYGFPSSILHFCVDGLGFEWALQPAPQTPECCKWDPPGPFLFPRPNQGFVQNHPAVSLVSVTIRLVSRAVRLTSSPSFKVLLRWSVCSLPWWYILNIAPRAENCK